MAKWLQKLKWWIYEYKSQKLLVWGLKHNYIAPYNDYIIEKLRNLYFGGLPESIILLSDALTNGLCYDRALLMARAFLDEEGDVSLIYADVDSIRLNPEYIDKDNPLYADHCIVEIVKNNCHFIIDTSEGFVYTKNIYWLLEHPKIRKINHKEAIIEFIHEEERYHPNNLENDKYIAPLIIPQLEKTYNRPSELYAHSEIELLQKEVDHYKEIIDYEKMRQEIKKDMQKLNLHI